MYDLERFITAQNEEFQKIKDRISSGKGRFALFVYVFPILNGIENSVLANFYGLNGKEEAEAYWKNEKLRENLTELTKAVFDTYGYGTKLDNALGFMNAQRFHSCMTLFYTVTKETLFLRAISKYFDGIFDDYTILSLKNMI